jgi:hypothetical protein
MKKLAFGLFLFVGLICRSDAQLNGEYTYDIASVFEKSIATTIFMSDAERLYVFSLCDIFLDDQSLGFCSTWTHDPKTGQIKGAGQVEFPDFAPFAINPLIEVGEFVEISSSKSTLSGKTYTDKSGVGRIDFSQTTQLNGTYYINGTGRPFQKGVITFSTKGKRLDEIGSADGIENLLQIKGSISLNKGKIKRSFNNSHDVGLQLDNTQLPYTSTYRSELFPDLGFDMYGSLYLDLNLSTARSAVSGTAKIYYQLFTDHTPTSSSSDEVITQPDDSGYTLTYSVKGSSKNGISTLSLTGLGKIKGLKATLYINDDTEEIIPNGKNSITLYGQTIKY